MFVLIGLAVGLAFGLASAFANRLWGTVLAALPMAGWFVFFAFALRDGLTMAETEDVCFALLGIVLGVFMGQLFDRQKRRKLRARATRPGQEGL